MLNEPKETHTFRIGLFGFDKLSNPEETILHFSNVLLTLHETSQLAKTTKVMYQQGKDLVNQVQTQAQPTAQLLVEKRRSIRKMIAKQTGARGFFSNKPQNIAVLDDDDIITSAFFNNCKIGSF